MKTRKIYDQVLIVPYLFLLTNGVPDGCDFNLLFFNVI